MSEPAALERTMSLAPGARLGPYEVVAKLDERNAGTMNVLLDWTEVR